MKRTFDFFFRSHSMSHRNVAWFFSWYYYHRSCVCPSENVRNIYQKFVYLNRKQAEHVLYAN